MRDEPDLLLLDEPNVLLLDEPTNHLACAWDRKDIVHLSAVKAGARTSCAEGEHGSYGAVEDVPLSEGQRQFDVNVYGAIRLIQLITPIMRRQRSGRIINVSSVGGEIHTPFGAWYHGSKFALEGMSNVLRIELAPFGIDVVVVQPGATKSEWSAIAADHLRKTSAGRPAPSLKFPLLRGPSCHSTPARSRRLTAPAGGSLRAGGWEVLGLRVS
ncbi:SDR family NAD(P)-dependent oxidoreductase [Actinoplanes sp. LDG1-06]|uniref:SDR family NAD(P)-dependent oxidoreductase n=1 Tax=Paractinoplanes ovalisporus TaxID=2810368 RepID=A0ABS2AQI4_9ACTN|nr:SDR family NAD(P)-dependent oxidoreductase [Actinoplanes ovalisporus]MBM2622066.1 SDR family NAD(P)-dependent oxidoreductase [Actinoplanes ovalisporus]